MAPANLVGTTTGGDKHWPCRKGTRTTSTGRAQISDALDAGVYEFKILSQGSVCKVLLEDPPDPRTGWSIHAK